MRKLYIVHDNYCQGADEPVFPIVRGRRKAVTLSLKMANKIAKDLNSRNEIQSFYRVEGKRGTYGIKLPTEKYPHYSTWIVETSAELISDEYCEYCDKYFEDENIYVTDEGYVICRGCINGFSEDT